LDVEASGWQGAENENQHQGEKQISSFAPTFSLLFMQTRKGSGEFFKEKCIFNLPMVKQDNANQ